MSEARLRIERAISYEWRDVDASGLVDGACPGCGADPFRVVAVTLVESADDHTDRAGTRCVTCHDPVGWLYIDRPTIFGRSEDWTVLNGRPRVYS